MLEIKEKHTSSNCSFSFWRSLAESISSISLRIFTSKNAFIPSINCSLCWINIPRNNRDKKHLAIYYTCLFDTSLPQLLDFLLNLMMIYFKLKQVQSTQKKASSLNLNLQFIMNLFLSFFFAIAETIVEQ